jgi:hypothetical protein
VEKPWVFEIPFSLSVQSRSYPTVEILRSGPSDGNSPISSAASIARLSGGLGLSDGALRGVGTAAVIDVDVTGRIDILGAVLDVRLSGTETFDVMGG